MSSDTATTTTLTGTYNVDPSHTRIGFVARHAMVTKVRGTFNEFEGSGYFDEADPTKSHLKIVIQARSIDTRNEDRDNHIRSNDFLDLESYPEITFESTSVSKVDDEHYDVTGDLTVRGVTKSLTIPFELSGPVVDPWGGSRIGLEGSVVVNRKDWGVNWNTLLEAGGVLVSEKVTLEFEVAAVRADG